MGTQLLLFGPAAARANGRATGEATGEATRLFGDWRSAVVIPHRMRCGRWSKIVLGVRTAEEAFRAAGVWPGEGQAVRLAERAWRVELEKRAAGG